jgi:uncharacterized membrane protein
MMRKKKLLQWLPWVCSGMVVVLGLVIRFYDFSDPPLDFNSTRQLHSALIARGIYYQNLESAPLWQREMAERQWEKEGLIEPPIMESLAALAYRFLGEENILAGRILSILFWMAGGVFLLFLGRELTGTWSALIGLTYFLILPFGAIASRAFMPDPLMTALIVAALWGMARWNRSQSWRWTAAAGLLAGLAIFVKSVAIFFIAGAWIGLLLGGFGLKRAVKSPMIWTLAALTILPYALFHIYGLYISGRMTGQFNLRFFPQLWQDPVFYLQWNGELSSTVGFEWFLMALLSTLLLRQRAHRAMLLGAWAGYFIYGMALPFHISTHNYYQLPLIPIVALGLAAGAETLFANLRSIKPIAWGLTVLVILFAVVIKAWDVRVTLKRDSFTEEPAYWQKLGDQLGQGVSITGLTQDYGYRLAYWGWVESDQWMSSSDFNYRQLGGAEFDMDKLFAELTTGKDFFVVTIPEELEKQPKLKILLNNNYPVVAIDSDALVFDLQHPLEGSTIPLQ